MLIPKLDAKLFFELYPSVIGYAAGKSKTGFITDSSSFMNADAEERLDARNALFDDISVLKHYVDDNPDGFREQDLALVSNWRHFVRNEFILERDLKNYTVFLDMHDSQKGYGICGLFSEIRDMVPFIPILITTILLPWKDAVVCDGLFTYQSISFGKGMRSMFKEQYLTAKKHGLVVTSEDFIELARRKSKALGPSSAT